MDISEEIIKQREEALNMVAILTKTIKMKDEEIKRQAEEIKRLKKRKK